MVNYAYIIQENTRTIPGAATIYSLICTDALFAPELPDKKPTLPTSSRLRKACLRGRPPAPLPVDEDAVAACSVTLAQDVTTVSGLIGSIEGNRAPMELDQERMSDFYVGILKLAEVSSRIELINSLVNSSLEMYLTRVWEYISRV